MSVPAAEVIDLTADSIGCSYSAHYGGGFTRLLKRVLRKCELEKRNNSYYFEFPDVISRAVHLTGLHREVINTLFKGGTIPIETTSVDRSVIYNELLNFYLKQMIIPTTKQLYDALYGKIPAHVDIATFRRILVKMDFVWRKLTESMLVVMERPSVTFERYEYVKKLIHYRQKELPIYFIDENFFDVTGNYNSLLENLGTQCEQLGIMMTDTQLGIIYAVSKSGIFAKHYTKQFNQKQFQDWVLFELIPILSSASIIVINKSSHHCKQIITPPTFDSLKIEMIEWLDYHNVPCAKKMSKVQLWALIENYTNPSKNMYVVDNILKVFGHTVLRLPNCINELTPTSLVFELIRKHLSMAKFSDADDLLKTYEATLNMIIDSITNVQLAKYDNFIAKEENNIYEKEIRVDLVLDTLIRKMQQDCYIDNEDSDLPTFSDSD